MISNKQKTKFNIEKAKTQHLMSHDDKKIAFSLTYLTSNKRYTFDYYNNKQKNDRSKAINELYNRLFEISHMTWEELKALDKKRGYENLPYGEIGFSILHEVELKISKDSNIQIIRFDKGTKRILGIKQKSCPILHIIGFDFDYSAYNHGS